MFTEFEIATMVEEPAILEATKALKQEFVNKEAEFLDISDHDFLALAMMTPTVGIALANGSVSLFEELALNKKARKLSKGGYFLKRDPVVDGMKYLIKDFDIWRNKFLSLIKVTMENTFDVEQLIAQQGGDRVLSEMEFKKSIMTTPYVAIRFIASFFMEDDEDIFSERNISKVEYDAMVAIGKDLGMNRIPVFNKIYETTFKIR